MDGIVGQCGLFIPFALEYDFEIHVTVMGNALYRRMMRAYPTEKTAYTDLQIIPSPFSSFIRVALEIPENCSASSVWLMFGFSAINSFAFAI